LRIDNRSTPFSAFHHDERLKVDETRRPFDRALADRYAVERTLGQGGMGSVYLAEDVKHHRKVAVKVLRPDVAAALGAERFLREIDIAARLNHPHILALYDSGTADGFLFFVMPYIAGDSLRQKLEREGQLAVEEALRITTQVASALDYAHAQGLVHRDIKPENILLHEREALIADFGIALAMSAAAPERLTATGVWLGTPSYTSPEQATGERTLDARSDVYSLGCVCYEMLAGEPPYAGKGQALMVKHAVDPVPAVRRLRPAIPAGVDQAIQRALAKAPADRFASAGELAEALTKGVAEQLPRRVVAGRRLVNFALIALAIVMAGAAIWGWIRPAPSKPVVRYTLVVDSTQALASTGTSWSGRIALSPDGSHLAYIGPRSQLLVRPRNQLRATVIPGTQGANTPFFSPDGNRVGFLREEQVHIASMSGGQPISVADTLSGVSGASWGRDGFIYLDGGGVSSLLRVEAKPGARPRWFTTLDTARGEIDHTWPEVLPNGKGVLFTVMFARRTGAQGTTSYAIAVAEIPSGKHRVICG
jgi:serine/threonine-protein kinase